MKNPTSKELAIWFRYKVALTVHFPPELKPLFAKLYCA
jgi:hypothetical protein